MKVPGFFPFNRSMPQTETHGELQPASPSELCRFLRENCEGDRRAIIPAGGRTALHYGRPITQAGVYVSTARLNRLVDYPARDMTVTVEAGMRIDDFSETLGKERQQLPVDVPQSNRATIGGVVATNTSGPRRFGYGTLRDYVIGVSAVDAQGRLFKAGGRVVKNVAGYDLCKLLIGSLGTLAVISQLTLKLRPLPESSLLLWVGFPDWQRIEQALEKLLLTAARPTIVDVLNRSAAVQVAAEARVDLPADRPVLILGVEGNEKETDWQVNTLKDELSDESPLEIGTVPDDASRQVLESLTEFTVGSEEPLTFRAAVPPSKTIPFLETADRSGMALQAHAGNGVVIGHLPDEVLNAEQAQQSLQPLIELVNAARGSFSILQCDESWKSTLPVFGDPLPGWNVMHRLKQQMDPHDLLNPGRLFDANHSDRE